MSTLVKAFRGELVPQDPNNESASALLTRVRAEREAADSPGGSWAQEGRTKPRDPLSEWGSTHGRGAGQASKRRVVFLDGSLYFHARKLEFDRQGRNFPAVIQGAGEEVLPLMHQHFTEIAALGGRRPSR